MDDRTRALRRTGSCAAPACAAALAIAAIAPARAAGGDDDAASATPYRPSVSTPAALSAPGWVEIEAGLQHDHDGGVARRDSTPLTLKLAFTPDWGVRIGADGWVRQRADDASRTSGYGDTSIVVKRRFAIDDGSAFGLEGGATLPTGRAGIGSGSGSGKPDWFVTAIHSADFFADWHSDLNLAATRIGARAPGTGRRQMLWAGSLSRSFGERWSAGAELSGTTQSGVDSTRQLLVSASYSVTRRLVVDAGAARSLRSGATWSAFAGFTWLAARIF